MMAYVWTRKPRRGVHHTNDPTEEYMDKSELAAGLLAGLGETLTVPDLKFDPETNSSVLVFDNNLVVNVEFDAATGRIVLSAYLGELPEEGSEPALREFMAANLYWHRTRGATLCLEEGTGGIILVYGHAVTDLDAARFEAVVENFVNQAEKWSARLVELRSEANRPVAVEAGDDQTVMMRI